MINHIVVKAIPPTGMTLTPMPGTSIKPSTCADQNANCKAYDIPAVCVDYAGWARDNCQASCGMCPGTKLSKTSGNKCFLASIRKEPSVKYRWTVKRFTHLHMHTLLT